VKIKSPTSTIILLCAILTAGGQAGPSAAERSNQVTLQYIAHACFRITSPSGSTVMIDPYESRWWLGYDFPSDLDGTDAVLSSHPHSDHDGGLAADRRLPWSSDTPVIKEPGSYKYGDIEVIGIRGKHAEPYGKEFGQTNTIWLIEVAGLRIVHVGDNGPITDAIVKEVGRVDLLMLPIDSLYHILKHEEIETYRAKLTPQVLVPMHYRHPDLEPDPDAPDDLGEIEGWLKEQDNVRRLGTHVWGVARSDLPDTPAVVVFEHSPKVKPPS
jgi:L-ascorbate metabolism protein UlaG (beta-lactamase superfamily)